MLIDLDSYRRALQRGNPGRTIPAEAVTVYALQCELADVNLPPLGRAFQTLGNATLRDCGLEPMPPGHYRKGTAWLRTRDGGRDADSE